MDYREKIYNILVQMHEAVPAIHTANCVWVTAYPDCYPIQCIEGLLRSTLDVQDKQNSRLSELAEFYANIQESSIRSKLEAASYTLASEADACLVGGTGRPESVSDVCNEGIVTSEQSFLVALSSSLSYLGKASCYHQPGEILRP